MKLLGDNYNDDWKLFVRYVVGECTEREAEQVRSAIAADEDKAQFLDELQQLWGQAKRSELLVDKGADWARLNSKIREDARIHPLPAANRPSVAARERRSRPSRFLSARTSFILALMVLTTALGAAFLALRSERITVTEVQREQEVVTDYGQRATIRLTDGTLVYLNAGSKLTTPERFDSDSREVELEGEAFFEVARDASRPFIVRTPRAAVEVLGTAFNVSVYPGGERARVVVAEGRVSFRPTGAGEEAAVILNPRELGEISGEEPPVVHRDVDLDRFLGWREGRLVFQNSPFEEVAAQLERKYGIDVEFAGPPGAADGLTAVFQDEPLAEIVKSIATTLNLNYTWSPNKVSFYGSSGDM